MIKNDHFDRTNGSLVHLQYLHPPRVGDELDKSSHPSLSSQSWPITAHHGVTWPHADQSQDSHSPIIAFLHLPRKRKMLRVGCWLSIPAPSFQAPHQMQNRYLERHRAARRRLGKKYRKTNSFVTIFSLRKDPTGGAGGLVKDFLRFFVGTLP